MKYREFHYEPREKGKFKMSMVIYEEDREEVFDTIEQEFSHYWSKDAACIYLVASMNPTAFTDVEIEL